VAGQAYETVKTAMVRLTADDKNRKFTIKFSIKGKARLIVKDEAGTVHLSKEYSSSGTTTLTEDINFKKKLGSIIDVSLEIAALDAKAQAENTAFEVTWGKADVAYGVMQSTDYADWPINREYGGLQNDPAKSGKTIRRHQGASFHADL
jgi:hypothetical protein